MHGDLAEPVGVWSGEFAQGGEVLVEGGSGPAERGDDEQSGGDAEEDGWPPAGASPGDEAVGGEADDSGAGGEEHGGNRCEEDAGEVDEAVVHLGCVGSVAGDPTCPTVEGMWDG